MEPISTAHIEADQKRVSFPLGVRQALEIFKACCPQGCERHATVLARIDISADNTHWTSPDGHPGGDAYALFDRFAGRMDPWGTVLEELLKQPDHEVARLRADSPLEVVEPVSAPEETQNWVELLPTSLRDYAKAIADQFTTENKVPAALAIGVASASLGRGIQLRTTRGRTTSPNLYFIGSARTGGWKTAIGAPIFRALHKAETTLIEARTAEVKTAKLQLRLVEARLNQLIRKCGLDGDSPEQQSQLAELQRQEEVWKKRAAERRLCTEDATSEKLALIAHDNGGLIASVSSDATGVLATSLGRYTKQGNLDINVLLKGFSDEELRQDRVQRESVNTRICMTVLWMLQSPAVVTLFQNQALSDSGLLGRFAVFPIEPPRVPAAYDEMQPPSAAQQAFERQIDALINAFHERNEPQVVSASEDARRVLVDYENEVAREIDGGELAWLANVAKRRSEIAWRVALVVHAFEHGASAVHQNVNENAAAAAVSFVRWCSIFQEELAGKAVDQSCDEKLAVALAFVNRCGESGSTAESVYRSKQGLFHSVKGARAVLDQLVAECSVVYRSRRFYRRFNPRN
jgi:hypothetical protein